MRRISHSLAELGWAARADLLTTRTRMGWFGMRCTTLAAAVIREKRERSCRLGRYSRLTLGRADVESDGQRLGSMPDVSP